MSSHLEQLFRAPFAGLSWWRKTLVRIGVGCAGVGAAGQAVAVASEQGAPGPGSWSWSLLGAGVGCLVGFVVGAAVRTYIRLGLIAVAVLVGGVFALRALGWIELPGSASELSTLAGEELARQTSGLRAALTGFLPSSTMTGLGVFAGFTQKRRPTSVRGEEADGQ